MEPEHQAWKQAVMAGDIQLEDIDLADHKRLAVMDVIDRDKQGRASQEQIQAIALAKERAST